MATSAKTRQDVEGMTRQDRLWDSLSHSYGQQLEETGRSYDRAISQADRQALSRGMQRSSYNAQNLANINQQRINAENNIRSNMIADYENRLGALESEEAEAERWERQFEANRADVAWNQNFQQGQADLAAQQWEREFTRGTDSADRQLAASYVSAIVAQGGTPSDDLLARAGLSRADAEAMRKGATGGSSGGPGPSNPGSDTPPGNPDALFDDVNISGTIFDRFKNISDLVAGTGAVTAAPGITAGPYTPPSAPSASTTTGARNPNAERSFSAAFVDPNDPIVINPIEEAFSSPRVQTVTNPVAVYRTPIDDRAQSSQEWLTRGKKRENKRSNETWSAYH